MMADNELGSEHVDIEKVDTFHSDCDMEVKIQASVCGLIYFRKNPGIYLKVTAGLTSYCTELFCSV